MADTEYDPRLEPQLYLKSAPLVELLKTEPAILAEVRELLRPVVVVGPWEETPAGGDEPFGWAPGWVRRFMGTDPEGRRVGVDGVENAALVEGWPGRDHGRQQRHVRFWSEYGFHHQVEGDADEDLKALADMALRARGFLLIDAEEADHDR